LVMGGQSGPGAADGTQSIPVMRQALPIWNLFHGGADGNPLKKPGDYLGLAIWNHGQGHVFGSIQLERARYWFDWVGAK